MLMFSLVSIVIPSLANALFVSVTFQCNGKFQFDENGACGKNFTE